VYKQLETPAKNTYLVDMRILVNFVIVALLLFGNYEIVATMNWFTENRAHVLLWVILWTLFWGYIFYWYNRRFIGR